MLVNDFQNFFGSKKHPIDIIVVMVFSIIGAVFAITLNEGNPLRILCGLPLTIFFPGYAVTSFLWPGEYANKETSGRQGIGHLERFGLAIGLSLVSTALIGISLNYIWEISLVPMLVFMVAFILVSGTIGWYRRLLLPENERFSIPLGFLSSMKSMGQADKLLTTVVAISIISSAFVIIYTITVPYEGEKYTEFYMIDQNRTVQNFPTNLSVNEAGTIIIGIISHEYELTNYTVLIRRVNETGIIQNITIHSYNVTLDHLEKSEVMFSFSMDQEGEYKLILELYIPSKDEVYREIHLWVDVN